MEYRTTFLNGSEKLKEEGLKTLQSVREDLDLLLFHFKRPLKEVLQELKDRFGVEIDPSQYQWYELDVLKEDILEEIERILNEYPLCFDYLPEEGFFRYQIAWGGPQYEVRFYTNGLIEFAYLDWFTGVGFDVTDDIVFQRLKEVLEDSGLFDWAYKEAVDTVD